MSNNSVSAVTGRVILSPPPLSGSSDPLVDNSRNLTVDLQVRKLDSSANVSCEKTVIGGKTYNLRVLKRGTEFHPQTHTDSDSMKTNYGELLRLANLVDKTIMGAQKYRFSAKTNTLTILKDGKTTVMQLSTAFDDKAIDTTIKPQVEKVVKTICALIKDSYISTTPLTGRTPASNISSHEASIARFSNPDVDLDDDDIEEFLKIYQREHSGVFNQLLFSKVQNVRPGTKPNFSEIIRSELESQDLPNTGVFAIPLREDNHLKLVFINFDRKTIDYYDPRGCDKPSNVLMNAALSNLLEELNAQSSGWAMNTTSPQHLPVGKEHNSGHCILAFIRSHFEGNGQSLKEDPNTFEPDALTALINENKDIFIAGIDECVDVDAQSDFQSARSFSSDSDADSISSDDESFHSARSTASANSPNDLRPAFNILYD